MNKYHTPEQFTSPTMLIVVGLVGLLLGCSLVLRAFDTGSGWQYLLAALLIGLSIKLFKKAADRKR